MLATAQTDGAQNGIWIAADGAWWRADDWGTDTYAQLGTSVVVLEGSNAAVWTMTSPTEGNKYGAIVLGTDEPVFQVASFLSHGNLAGGSLHAVAVAGVSAGFMSAADKALHDDHEAKLNTEYAQASDGNTPTTLIDQLTVGSIRGLDAQAVDDQPDPLFIAGGRPHSTLIGVDTNHNVIHHGGIGGTALNGEGGQLNFFGGDYRVPGCPPVLCGEIGYTWQFDYDLDPTSGLPRTPYALRLHSGVNPNTNSRTRLVLQGYDSLSMESQFSNVITTVTAGNAIQLFISTTSSGNGLLEDNVAGYVQLSGATPGTITIANRIPLTKLAHCDLTVISKSTDYDSREVFRLKFTWFGTVIALIETVADVGGYPSSAGRVSLTDSGTSLVITCTGLADGRTRNVTARLRLEIQQ
ncbi:MAG: hypothetical protein IPG04_17365 [Polyangiaceae bacterium]|nr:hypothetical protein [Polyangiaceae bacterium]